MSTLSASVNPNTSKTTHYALWGVQLLLAAAFFMAGVMKLSSPMAELIEKMVWPGALPEGLVRFIGLAEVLGALGLVLPSATRIQPKLTPLAAAGLVTVMLLASVFHLTRGEYPAIAFDAVLGGLAAFVAWGRAKASPLAAR